VRRILHYSPTHRFIFWGSRKPLFTTTKMTAQKIDIIIGASPATPATKNLSSPNWKNYNDQIVESYNQI